MRKRTTAKKNGATGGGDSKFATYTNNTQFR